jgi:hypothetical protein
MKVRHAKYSSAVDWTRRNWIWIATASTVAVGAVLRIRQYLPGRSLWLDEVMLTLNILGRSYRDLLKPLDYAQGAPLGFLLLEKAVTNFAGQDEYALRLLPLISGILALFIFPFVARKYLSPRNALWAVILFSFANPLIYYASEVKQYSGDVLATVLCLVLFLFMLERELRVVDVLWLGISGATLIWLSHPVIFVLSATGLIIVLISLRERDVFKAGLVTLVGLAWGASFLLSMAVSLDNLSQNPTLLQFWSGGFFPSTAHPAQLFDWLLHKLLVMFDKGIGLPLTGLALALSLLGAFAMARRDKPRFFSLVLPMLFVLMASYLQRYPFTGRLILFLTPLLMLLLAEGIEQILVLPDTGYLKVASWLVVFLLLIQPVKQALEYAWYPRLGEDIVPAIEYVHQNWLEGDTLYVYYGSYAAFNHYLPLFPFPEENIIAGTNATHEWTKYFDEMDMLSAEHGRVWLIFSHIYADNGANEEVLLIRYLDRIGGKQIGGFLAAGATAYLYEFSNESAPGMVEQNE